MARFFVDEVSEPIAYLYGEDAAHASKSLRMKKGEQVTLCDKNSTDCLCEITEITATQVELKVISKQQNTAEMPRRVRLYQAITKGDKFEYIIQKAVELGVFDVTPVLTARCISRPDKKAMDKKLDRYRKIAKEAAKQSGRGIVPAVNDMLAFEQAVNEAQSFGCAMICYEGGGAPIDDILKKAPEGDIAIFIGSEGGFETAEIELAKKSNIQPVTLGPRILRTETAPLSALAIVGFLTEN